MMRLATANFNRRIYSPPNSRSAHSGSKATRLALARFHELPDLSIVAHRAHNRSHDHNKPQAQEPRKE